MPLARAIALAVEIGDAKRYLITRALAHARLGQSQEAIRLPDMALESFPLEKDYVWTPILWEDCSVAFTVAGAHDRAIEMLEKYLDTNSYVSSTLLPVDPRWAPLRGYPQFHALAGRS